MSDQKKSSKFGIGLVLGSIIGAVSAFFLSPTTGEENREAAAKKIEELKKFLKEKEIDKKVKEIFDVVTDETKKAYSTARDWLVEELETLEETVEKFDKEEFVKSVEKVIAKMKKGWKKDVKQLEKLKSNLLKEWEKIGR